jgi:hypothetical protein
MLEYNRNVSIQLTGGNVKAVKGSCSLPSTILFKIIVFY